jgi:hypothetical protein
MRTLYLLALVLLIGCQSQTNKKIETNETINKIDSIINHSEQTFTAANQASAKSDSTINEKVEKTVKQITTLQATVQQLKAENNELKVKLDSADDLGKPFKLLPVSGNKDNR